MKFDVEKIKKDIDLVDFISHRIRLVKLGENFIGSCPFHCEDTPSFVVNRSKQIATCFGKCGESFDLIKFYSRFYNENTYESLRQLQQLIKGNNNSYKSMKAKKQISSPKFIGSEDRYVFEERFSISKEFGDVSLEDCHDQAISSLIEYYKYRQQQVYSFFINYLKTEWNQAAYEYLTGKQRGFSDETLQKYSICSIPDVERTIEILKDNFSREELLISGLFNDNGYFLFTRFQIVVPYFRAGQVEFIRGRYFYNGSSIPSDSKCKYISAINRTRTLSVKRFYNYELLQKRSPGDEVIICEGEFDTLSLIQLNFPAIGIPGTSCIPEDLNCLKDFRIFILFDNDQAGKHAAFKFINKIKSKCREVNLLTLKKPFKDVSEWMNTRVL